MKMNLNMKLNGRMVSYEIEHDARLLDVIRDEIGLTGTKEGCGVGECGACSVIVDGKVVNSCIVLAASMEGREVKTIEYYNNGDKLHPMHKSYIDNTALQCGFCTPGFVVSSINLLERNPDPSREEIIEGLSGNVCRCTGYEQIIKAVEDVKDNKYTEEEKN